MSKFRTAGWMAAAALLGVALVAPTTTFAIAIHQELPIAAGDATQNCDGAPALGGGQVYWHFVAQGGTISSTLTATFTGAGEIGPIAAYDSNGNATHFSVVTNTGAGEVLTAAVVNPATQVQLSHVCVGVEQSASASLPVASEVASSVPSGSVLAETGTPRVTPPSTDAMPGVATTTGSSWALVLVALVAVLGAALLLTPARPRR